MKRCATRGGFLASFPPHFHSLSFYSVILSVKGNMNADDLDELTVAIMDGILEEAILSVEKLPSFAKRPERLMAYELEICNAKKEALEDALSVLLWDHYGRRDMETEAFDKHQELVIQPRIAQSETDAAVDNHEAQLAVSP